MYCDMLVRIPRVIMAVNEWANARAAPEHATPMILATSKGQHHEPTRAGMDKMTENVAMAIERRSLVVKAGLAGVADVAVMSWE